MFDVVEKDLPHRTFKVLDVKMVNSLPYFLIYRCGEFVYATAKDFDLIED
ncbi:MAG: hypothetical protein KBT27_06615 [Prevotellaceae bacterium]|nr:hypothetical protein [Candidatus Faecinaster equi]